MSTKEKICELIEFASPNDLELFYSLLQRFVFPGEIPNEETIEALLETDALAQDPNAKRYTSIEALMEALEEE